MQSFNELSLNPSLLRAITEMGFEKPSPVQAEALPILLGEPTDFVGLAATGTGKTAAFALPLLTNIDPHHAGVQGLILCPTRELAMQVAGQIEQMGRYLGVKAVAIYGGAPYAEQIRGLNRGAQIVVGTPGRVVDHLTRGTLRLDGIRTLVLDEADEMISMGFQDDLEAVLGAVPEGQARKWLFSATMSREVRKVADQYLHEPAQVQINGTEMVPDTVEQVYYATQESNKPEVLCKILDAAGDVYGIVFCQTKALVMELTQYLNGRGYRVDCLHGDMDQNARDRVMRAFRERKVTLLVATDVACRGLDVKDITHVINYSIPRELDNYVHRIGRTGRSGKAGLALSLVTPSHRGLVKRIERVTNTQMREGRIPTRKEIGALRVARSLKIFLEQSGHERANELLDAAWRESLAGMEKEEIAARFLALLHPESFAEREEARAVRASGVLPVRKREDGDEDRSAPRGRDERVSREGYGGPRRAGGYGIAAGARFGGRPKPSGAPAVVIPIVRDEAAAQSESLESGLPTGNGVPLKVEKLAVGETSERPTRERGRFRGESETPGPWGASRKGAWKGARREDSGHGAEREGGWKAPRAGAWKGGERKSADGWRSERKSWSADRKATGGWGAKASDAGGESRDRGPAKPYGKPRASFGDAPASRRSWSAGGARKASKPAPRR
jgi:ATP-dependent RNA helicase DeaD